MVAAGFAVLASGVAPCSPELAAVFTDHVVLQRDCPVPVWGRADAGELITVSLADRRNAVTADGKGHWLCELPPLPVGGPFELVVAGKATVTVRDVLVGEVWLCAGGSNMALDVQRADDAEKEIAAAKLPSLRLYRVTEAKRGWTACSPDTVADFSAVACFFGRELHQKLGVAVGLIEAAEPRSPAEAWTSREALAALPDFQRLLERMDNYAFEAATRPQRMNEWWAKALPAALAKDPGSQGDRWAAADPKTEGDAAWRPLDLPRDPEKRLADAWQPARGVAWFHREVELPAALAGRELVMRLGVVDDPQDAVYLNGARLEKKAAGLGVPAERAKAGRAVVAVRMVDLLGRGLTWLYADKERMKIEAADGAAGLPSVSLAGPWLYRVGVLAKGIELPSLPAALPPRPGEPDSPGALFPRLVEPLAPFGLRGVAWYQGEANVSRAAQYRTLFPALIADWRKAWKRPNLPFLFVQLAGCARKRATPGDDLWAELREAQALALRLPDTAMAVTLDLGHRATPPNKQEVSRRLALLARARLHGEPVPCSGPVYDAMAVEGDKIRARFKGAEGGLDVQGGDATRMLAIAGEDKRWLWADFKVEGETLVVWNRQVPKPVAVRYAWEHTPRFDVRPGEGWVTLGLLFNKAGLPAAPFRTDDWPGVGDERH